MQPDKMLTSIRVGSIIAGLAKNEGMLLGGRFLVGLGGGTANNASWVYRGLRRLTRQ